MSKHPIYEFQGKEINVSWDERLCIHIAECGQAKGELFSGGRKPWCLPDKSESNEVEAIVKRCPSGALSYKYNNGEGEVLEEKENTVNVIYNGPLYLQGDLDIDGATEDMSSIKFRAALCRCGASKNKPFCDNSHAGIKFKDFAAVGETGAALSELGGPLKVSAIQNGPLMLKGNLSIYAGSGRLAWQGESVALCRCGASKNKPFCDGMHNEIGFKS